MPPSVRGFCMGIAACGSAVRVQGRRMAMPPAGASGDVLWRKKPAGGARSCVGLRSRGLRRRLCPRRAVRSCAHLREHRRTYCEKTPGSRAVMCRLRSRGLRRRLCPRGAVRSCARLRERQETYCGDTPVRRSGRTAQKAEPAEDSCPYAYFFEKTLDKPEKCRYNRTVNQRQQVFVKA